MKRLFIGLMVAALAAIGFGSVTASASSGKLVAFGTGTVTISGDSATIVNAFGEFGGVYLNSKSLSAKPLNAVSFSFVSTGGVTGGAPRFRRTRGEPAAVRRAGAALPVRRPHRDPTLEHGDLLGRPGSVAGHRAGAEAAQDGVAVSHDIVVRPEVERPAHRLTVALAQERLDVGLHEHLGRTAERFGGEGFDRAARHVWAEIARQSVGDDVGGTFRFAHGDGDPQ